MRYFFFKTSMENQDGELKPTLRPLPGQTFDDGTTVEENYNVQSPKEAGSAIHGAQHDYPIGTYFCSEHLELVVTKTGNKYYSVYDKNRNKDDQEFYPVSDDPAFVYVSAHHLNDQMNAALVKFLTFGEQSTEDKPSKKASKKAAKPTARPRPMDTKGKATPIKSTTPAYVEAYNEQVSEEARLVVLWMRRVLTDMHINLGTVINPPRSSAELEKSINMLYAVGESIDYVMNRERFYAVMKSQKMDIIGLQNVSKGPLNWYIDELIAEHKSTSPSTAVMRDPAVEANVRDAALVLNTRMNDLHANSGVINDDCVRDLTKAMTDGWTLDEIINPDVLAQRDDLISLSAAIASGAIPPPQREADPSKTYIGQLFANHKNARPTDKEGFHVEELVWTLLIRNLNRHQATLVTGPTGSGKTELIRMMCERTNTPLTIIPMGTITDPTEQLIGKMDLDPATKGTKFDWADFALAVQRPGVILLDEINRCPRNGNNILFSVLDGTRTLTASGAKSSDQRNIKVNPDCVFFATANLGAEYTDTNDIDAAMRNRFMEIKVDYLDIDTEAAILSSRTGISKDDAKTIARIATSIRKSYRNNTLGHPVSTRETIICAELIRDGLEPELACEAAFLPSYEEGMGEKDPNSEQGTVRALIASQISSSK